MGDELFRQFVKLIWLNKKSFGSIACIAALLSLGLSFCMPEYYSATTTIYPVQLSSTPINETLLKSSSLGDFGERREAEQAIELLRSKRLMENLVDRFALVHHYGIDSNNSDAHTQALKKLEKQIECKRTLHQSIIVSIKDKNPEMAANLANAFVQYYDTLKLALAQERARELLYPLEVQLKKQGQIVDSLKKLKEEWTSKGLMSSFQRGFFIQAYGSSKGSERSEMKDQLDLNIANGMVFDDLEKRHDHELENLFTLNKYFIQTKSDAESMLSQKFVIDRAEIPEKPDWPIHWLFVLVSVASAECIALTFLLLNSVGIQYWNSKWTHES